MTRIGLALALALLLVSATLVSGCGRGDSSSSTPSESVEATTSPEAVHPGLEQQWVEVVTIDGGAYYGWADRGPSGYLLLESPYYPLPRSEEDTGPVRLRAVGDEFHRPDPFLLIPESSVYSIQELSAESAVLDVITTDLGGDPYRLDLRETSSIPLGSVFLKDGRILFGAVSIDDSGWLAVDDAYELQVSPDVDPNQPIDSLDDLVLSPLNDSIVGRSGPVLFRQSSVYFIERLGAESPVTSALVTE